MYKYETQSATWMRRQNIPTLAAHFSQHIVCSVKLPVIAENIKIIITMISLHKYPNH